MGWLSGWTGRKLKIVNGTSAGPQTNYQMKLTIQAGAGSDTSTTVYLNNNGSFNDFRDLRFTQSDGTTLIDYWLDGYTLVLGTSVDAWIEIPSIPASPGTTTIYIYYNNTSATNSSNGFNTFIAFDDFESGSLASWTFTAHATGTSIITDGSSKVLKVTDDGADWIGFITSYTTFTDGIVEARLKIADSNTSNEIAEIVARQSSTSTGGGYSHTLYRDLVSPDTKTNKIQRTHLATLVSQTFNFNFNQYYLMKFTLSGINLSTTIDGANSQSTTDATYASGRVGFAGNSLNAAGLFGDDIHVRVYANPEATFGASGTPEASPAIGWIVA